eukprot:123586-Prorocentrum_minimum.AAC.1
MARRGTTHERVGPCEGDQSREGRENIPAGGTKHARGEDGVAGFRDITVASPIIVHRGGS